MEVERDDRVERAALHIQGDNHEPEADFLVLSRR